MGLRIRKSIKIAPGVRLNFGKRGLVHLSESEVQVSPLDQQVQLLMSVYQERGFPM